ncbi:hypothetical protein [Lentzea sp. NEAU-D7]|uniref:hypothetical protein n=1 Tax=Lentzea sp. NEAU-D7 TaxID=2994667 RepID=UPI00224B1E4F|nr:hypothetical protein [Lentzea sp. NEAU-D7]MCX2949908.1 hypothetical protein [Lentzea sp. NEAU-D7]
MRITPRKHEVAAIVEVLEDGSYESAEALAKAVIKRVGEVLADREFYAWVHRFGPGEMQLAWGPFTSDSEVVKFATKAKLGGQSMSLRLCSTGAFTERLKKNPGVPVAACDQCFHLQGAHELARYGGKCSVRGCTCGQDQQ